LSSSLAKDPPALSPETSSVPKYSQNGFVDRKKSAKPVFDYHNFFYAKKSAILYGGQIRHLGFGDRKKWRIFLFIVYVYDTCVAL